MESQMMEALSPDESAAGEPYVLSGSNAHRYIDVPPFMIPQTMAFSFLQMNWLQHIVKVGVIYVFGDFFLYNAKSMPQS